MPPQLQCSAARALASSRGRPRAVVRGIAFVLQTPAPNSPRQRQYASAAGAPSRLSELRLPDDYVPPTKPPSARRPEDRKSQLLRTYTSLLRSTPLLLIFQHSNLTALEFAAVRRELNLALAKASEPSDLSNRQDNIASSVQLQVVRTRMFDVALKIVEFFDPASVPASPSGVPKPKAAYNHDLSKAAFDAIKSATAGDSSTPEPSTYAQLSPLFIGPLALLAFPTVSPAHLAAALRVLSPKPPTFAPPTRKSNPGYYDPVVQSGLQKLLLIGGRIEGKVFDLEGIRWVGSIDGGLDALRAQLVAILQSAGLGLTSALEGAGKSLWLTMENRRAMLEEDKGGEDATTEVGG